jgi:uncharacterized protein (TIGR04255 family)
VGGFGFARGRGKITAMSTAHPRLRKPPLIEAVFELRFSTETAYGLIPGRMFDALGDEFPDVEELQTATLPLDIPFPALVRHRFKSADGSKLLQTGHGVLSVNHVAYSRYNDLRGDVARVIEAVIELSLAKEVRRLGLRYINQMKLDRAWSSITTLTDHVPEAVSSKIRDRLFRYRLEYEPDRMNIVLANPTRDGDEKLLVDLDFFREEVDLPQMETQAILQWLDIAHERVYEAFTALLTEEYLEEIK